MKKIIAVLLCMATVFTCVACGSTKETTRKSKKTKKTKDTTEVTETDDTDEPSDSESESESETDPTEPENQDLIITHDLSAVEINKTRSVMMFGAVDSTKNEEPPYRLSSVEVGYDIPTASDSTTKIGSILDEYTHHVGEARTAAYQKKLDEFNELLGSGSELFDYWFSEFCEVIRSDSQILSMKIKTYGYSTQEDIDTKTIYESYDAMSGQPITLDDIILDKSAFAVYVEEYFNSIGADQYDTIADIHDQINDGSLSFGMTYDGIWISAINEIKLPVAGHDDIFNMTYFGSTPKNYTLNMGAKNELLWDFDGDGSLDNLSLTTEKTSNGYSIETLKINYMGKEYSFKASDFEEMDYMEELDGYSGSHVMCLDGKYYLLVSMHQEEDSATYTFDINGAEPKFIEVFFSTPEDTLDPEHFQLSLRTDIIGTVFMNYDFALSEDGHLKQLSSIGKIHSGPLYSIMPLPGKEFNPVTWELGAETEMPSSATIEILGYDNKSGLLYVRVHPKYTTTDTMDIALETDKQSKIAGQQRDSAFIGINYAD
ncbi:MAG: hypothetical protein J6Y58_00515 [Clostridiales bacterium]|nr:hypothetical protein [Clostridiales bacterium]